MSQLMEVLDVQPYRISAERVSVNLIADCY
jgi:hypothetical protein